MPPWKRCVAQQGGLPTWLPFCFLPADNLHAEYLRSGRMYGHRFFGNCCRGTYPAVLEDRRRKGEVSARSVQAF